MEINIMWFMIVTWAIAFMGTLIMTPVSIMLAKKTGAMDIPDGDRRIHEKSTPRIGGLGIFAGVTIGIVLPLIYGVFEPGAINEATGMATLRNTFETGLSEKEIQLLGILLGGAIIFLIGLIDDYKELSPWPKLLGQVGCATIVFFFGGKITFFSFFFDGNIYLSTAVSYILTVLWIVAITNTMNLVDGLDGLAAGTATIAALCIGYVGYIFGYYQGSIPMMAIAGATCAFLLFNFYPAKTFMGDCGSQFLGFMIASLAIVGTVKSATLMAVMLPGLALSLPILDTVFAIIRRIVQRKPIMGADKGHLHHRLLKSGMGQRRTVLCMYGVCAIMGIAAVLYSRQLYVEMIGLIFVAAVYIIVVLSDIDGKKIDKFFKINK